MTLFKSVRGLYVWAQFSTGEESTRRAFCLLNSYGVQTPGVSLCYKYGTPNGVQIHRGAINGIICSRFHIFFEG
jgi:hypothetical protein